MCSLRTRVVVPLGLFLLLGLLGGRAAAEEAAGSKIYRQTLPAAAWVWSDTGLGSGWLADRSRKLLVTNEHVVEGAESVKVFFPAYKDGKPITSRGHYAKRVTPIRGRVVDTDVLRDLAVIELESVPAEATELKLAAESASPGDRLHSVGNPGVSDALWVYSSGAVRAATEKRWAHLTGTTLVTRKCRVLETELPINHGDSGGPVVNGRGELVAVVSSGMDKDRNGEAVHLMTWHIDVAEVKALLDRAGRLLTPRTAADYNLRGVRYFLRARYDDAITDFSKAIELDPKFARAYANRADSFRRKKDYDTALADCAEALRLDPRDPPAYNVRGNVFAAQGDKAKAIADYSQAIQLDPRNGAAYANRAEAHYDRGEWDQAIADYDDATRLAPEYARAYNGRGNAYLAKKDYDRALRDYERALDLDFPYPASVLTNYGYTLYEAKQPERALDWFSEALKVDRRYARAYFWRGAAYEDLKEYARAEGDYNAAVRLDASYAKRAPLRQVCTLRVVNNTGEPLRVYLQYETLVNGRWTWLPADPKNPALTYSWGPGDDFFVAVEGARINARRVRIWAQGKNSGKRWVDYQNRDLWLPPEGGYRLRQVLPQTYEFR